MPDFTTTPSNRDYQLTVQVRPEYLANESDPQAGRWVFAYHVTITNTGRVAAQVISRHWIITDGEGQQQEVKGLAIVGHQPLLNPGEKFEYSSGTPLGTPHGMMRGSFFCVAADGERFEAPIAAFALSAPGGGVSQSSHTVH